MGKSISTAAIILLIVWGVGFIGGVITNALIHVVLGIAIILFAISIFGKKT